MTTWTERAAYCAEGLIPKVKAFYPCAIEVRDPEGKTVDHLLFMCGTLARRELDSDTKACRWLGYIQAVAIFHGITNLETEKERNLASRDAPAQ